MGAFFAKGKMWLELSREMRLALRAVASRLATVPTRLRVPPKKAERFYQSKEWRALVARVNRERGSRCQVPGCGSTKRVIADHIIERKDGGAELDPANIQLLCQSCHNAKTAKAKRARVSGR
ncbi:MAG: HNH endonuclease signature motif containing protein [Pseudomonadota bacterium]